VRAVIDANIVASHAISAQSPPARIRYAWERTAFTWLITESILQEYERVLSYERVRRYSRMADEAIAESIRVLRDGCDFVVVSEPIPRVSTDPKDDVYLACAVAGQADYIVSGDRHLLVLERYQGIPIVTPATFISLLDEHGSGRPEHS